MPAAYRKLIRPHIKRLPPVQHVLCFLLIFFVPLLYLRLRCDAQYVDNIHCASIIIDSSTSSAAGQGSLTVIRGDQLVYAVVRLAASNHLLAVVRPLREFIGPVHPVDTRIYMVFVACAYFQDAGNPVTVRLLPPLRRVVVVDGLLPLDAGVICDVNKALTKVFNPINCTTQRTMLI
jgi:hypothetical protein